MTPQERLEYFIKQKYKSKSAFAREMGDSPQMLNKYLNGDSVFSSWYKLQQLKRTGLNPEWYLTGEGEMGTKKFIKVQQEKHILTKVQSLLDEAGRLMAELQ